jgi:putative aminopeptidase FrvX
MRYSHSARELCDLSDLVALTKLLDAALGAIGADFSLDRDDYT